MGRAERQRELAGRLHRRDGFVQPLRTVAGFAARLGGDGAAAHAVAVLLDAGTLATIGDAHARVPAAPPAGPDELGFEVVPALLEALGRLPAVPDVALVRGHGLAHPRRLGVAAHFGVVADLPTVGVADAPLLGTAAALHPIRGAHTPLRDGREQVGWLLRSRPGAAPLVVSPGHRVSMTAAAQLAMRFVADDRLPEPIRLADALLAARGG